MAEFVTDPKGVATFSVCVERHVSGLGQCIFLTLGAKSPELIREAEIDVITEPGFVRPVVPLRCKRCNDVLLASLAVLGC